MHIKDHVSKFSALFAQRSKEASECATNLHTFIKFLGSPDICQSDNGKEFKGVLLILLKRYGIQAVYGRARTPRTQGLVEQGNSVIKDKLRKWMMETGSNRWSLRIEEVMVAMNKQGHESLPVGITAGRAIFSRKLKNEIRVPLEERGLVSTIPEAIIDQVCNPDIQDLDETDPKIRAVYLALNEDIEEVIIDVLDTEEQGQTSVNDCSDPESFDLSHDVDKSRPTTKGRVVEKPLLEGEAENNPEATAEKAKETADETAEEAVEGNYQPLEDGMGKLFPQLLDIH